MTEYRSVWSHLFRVPHKLAWVNINGVNTRYLEAGDPDAPPVIMLHGSNGFLENFLANIGPFSKQFRVLAVDMIGSGWTDKPDYPYSPQVCADHVRGFMDALGIEQAAFVGMALGAAVTAYIAHTTPERLSCAVLIGPALIVSDPEAYASTVAAITKRREDNGDPTWDSVHKTLSSLMVRPEDVLDDLVALRLAIYSTDEAKAARMHSLETTKVEHALSHDAWRALQTPMLVISSVDSVGSMWLKNAELIGKLVPNVEVVEIPGCRVWAQFEQADAFNAAAIPYIQRHLPARAI
jgi:2-hydroxy-6-oxonona-2,4-dienedioate hydrolase